jgi:hypothetical protein
METIRKHQNKTKEYFGQLTFQMEVVKGNRGSGNPQKYLLLTENQAIFIATLSRNTD